MAKGHKHDSTCNKQMNYASKESDWNESWWRQKILYGICSCNFSVQATVYDVLNAVLPMHADSEFNNAFNFCRKQTESCMLYLSSLAYNCMHC